MINLDQEYLACDGISGPRPIVGQQGRFGYARFRNDLPGGWLHEDQCVIQASRGRANFGFLWLSLAIIFAHALSPAGSRLLVASGSAFNGFTSEVSLGPSRASAPERDRAREIAKGDPGGSPAPAMLPAGPVARPGHGPTGSAFPPQTRIGAPAQVPARGFRARAPPSTDD